MADIADVGLRIDSAQISQAIVALNKFAESATKTSAAVANLRQQDERAATSTNTIATGALKAAEAARQAAEAELYVARARRQVAESDTQYVTATKMAESASRAAETALKREEAALHAVARARKQLEVSNTRSSIATSRYAQNFTTQWAGVSMNYAKAQEGSWDAGNAMRMRSASRAADVEAYGNELDRLRAKFNPIYAAEKNYLALQNEINTAAKVGAINEKEQALALAAAKNGYDKAVVAAKSYGDAAAQAGAKSKSFGGSLTNLSFQMNDVISGIMMGQSPFQILAQQGGQIFQVWQMNHSVFKDMASLLKGLITPTRVLAGGVLGLGAAYAYLYSKQIEAEKAMRGSLAGTGRGSGLTVGGLSGIATNAAQSSGMTVGGARTAAMAFAHTGALSGAQIGQLTSIVKDYAATTGQDATNATDQLKTAFSNLGTGIGTLSNQIGGIDYGTQLYIKSLIAAGDQEKAVNVAIAAMKPNLVDHRNQLTLIGRAWEDVKSGASNYISSLFGLQSDNDTLTQLRARLQEIRDAQAGMVKGSDLWKQREASAKSYEAQIKKITDAQNKAGVSRSAERSRKLGATAGAYVDQLAPGTQQKQALQDQLTALQKLGDNQKAQAAFFDKGKRSYSDYATAVDRATHAVNTFLTPEEKAQKLTAISVREATARTAGERASIAMERERINLAGSAVSQAEADQRIRAAGASVIAAQNAQIKQQNTLLQMNVAGALQVAAAWAKGNQVQAQRTQAMAAARSQVYQAGGAGSAANIARGNLTIENAGAYSSAAQAYITQQNQMRATMASMQAVRSGTIAPREMQDYQERYLRNLDLETTKAKALANNDLDLAKNIQTLIDQYAKMDARKTGQSRTQETMNWQTKPLESGFDSLASAATDFNAALSGNYWEAWQNAGMSAIQDLLSEFMKLAVFNPLKNQLFYGGTNQYPTISGSSSITGTLGTMFGSLLGGSSSTQATGSYNASSGLYEQAQSSGMNIAASNSLGQILGQSSTWESLASMFGFADGVVGVSGSGGSKDDKILAKLSNGESVVSTSATGKNKASLSAMSSGVSVDSLLSSKSSSPTIIYQNNSSQPITARHQFNADTGTTTITVDDLVTDTVRSGLRGGRYDSALKTVGHVITR